MKTLTSLLFTVLFLCACVPSAQVYTQTPSATSTALSFTPTASPSSTPTAVSIPPVPTLVGSAAPSLPTTAFQNKVYQKDNTYYFEYTDNTTTIQYAYLPATGSLHDLRVKINDEAPFYPSNFGGPYFVEGKYEIPIWQVTGNPFQLSSSRPILDTNGLKITWNATSSKHTISYSYHFSISGKSLQMDISSDGSDISEFSFDRSDGTLGAHIVNIPYLTTINLLLFTIPSPIMEQQKVEKLSE